MSHAAFRELAYRNQNGLEVTLLWDSRSNEVSVKVIDQLDDSGFRLPIPGHLALDAFNHPTPTRSRTSTTASASCRGRRRSD